MIDIHLEIMNKSIGRLVRRAFFLSLGKRGRTIALGRIALSQGRAARRRGRYRAEGTPVPAFMIASVTGECNLRCAGCYAMAGGAGCGGEAKPALGDERLLEILSEAERLGVSFILLAGGEPLTRKKVVLEAAKRSPSVIFPLFTNGTLIDPQFAKDAQDYPNLVPILSIEGNREATDSRRGQGVYDKLLGAMETLKEKGILFGVSVTVMKSNLAESTGEAFVKDMLSRGASVFFYNEYTPIEAGTECMALSINERSSLLSRLAAWRKRFPALFLAFPGDEDTFGGCLSSSRGFVHLASDGSLEACPFAPLSDSSARGQPLAEALRSPLLAAIREHHDELSETSGGCALWNRRDWAESLLKA